MFFAHAIFDGYKLNYIRRDHGRKITIGLLKSFLILSMNRIFKKERSLQSFGPCRCHGHKKPLERSQILKGDDGLLLMQKTTDFFEGVHRKNAGKVGECHRAQYFIPFQNLAPGEAYSYWELVNERMNDNTPCSISVRF